MINKLIRVKSYMESFVLNQELRFRMLYKLGVYGDLSDEDYLKKLFKIIMGYELNLDNPRTFNEKLQWLKLYDRRPEYTMMVDKYAVKKYIAESIGEQYVIPTIGVWDSFDEIDFSKLPNQFVLKCTHDSGGVVICKDKNEFDVKKAKEKLEYSMARNFYNVNREWQYKGVQPRIIAEEYMSSIEEASVEYKMFCFNGNVKMILVCHGEGHSNNRTNDYCDINLKRLPFTSVNPITSGEVNITEKRNELIEIAEKLSVGIPHVRVDMYLVDEKLYFGELTFRHNSGFEKFDPEEWDEKIGEWIELPERY